MRCTAGEPRRATASRRETRPQRQDGRPLIVSDRDGRSSKSSERFQDMVIGFAQVHGLGSGLLQCLLHPLRRHTADGPACVVRLWNVAILKVRTKRRQRRHKLTQGRTDGLSSGRVSVIDVTGNRPRATVEHNSPRQPLGPIPPIRQP